MKNLIVCIFILIEVGCSSNNLGPNGGSIVVHRFGEGAVLTNAQLHENIDRANHGDGEAAYRVWAHYAIGSPKPGKKEIENAQKYFDLAVTLEYPPALYTKAVILWNSGKAEPVEVLKYLKRAIELGRPDTDNLLPEVEAKVKVNPPAKKT